MQQEKLALPIENVRLMLLLLQLQKTTTNIQKQKTKQKTKNKNKNKREKKRKEPMAVKCTFDAATKIASHCKNARLMLPKNKCQSLRQCTKSVKKLFILELLNSLLESVWRKHSNGLHPVRRLRSRSESC